MRYIKKIPTTDKNLSNKLISEGWKKLKEPSNLVVATLLSMPFMIINAIISITIAYYLYTPLKEFLISDNGFRITIGTDLITLIYIIAIFLFMTIHEFIHASFIPNVLKSDKTYLGINILFGFVYTTEKIKKSRYIIICFMPFLLLSIILPFVLNSFGWLNWFTLFLCLVNATGSCVDFLNMCIVAIQVPNGSYIVSNGLETYFK